MKCLYCGKEFEPINQWQKYCSYFCYKKAQRLRRIKETIKLSEDELQIRQRLLDYYASLRDNPANLISVSQVVPDRDKPDNI